MPSSLKQEYGTKDWLESNAREYMVLAWLNKRLLFLFREHYAYAKLTGLGAGSHELEPGRYTRPEDAFDITVYIDDRPCCWVEVTGECCWEALKGYDGDKARVPLCVGLWKLRKAAELRVLDRLWFAFALLKTGTIKVVYARRLYELYKGEAPWTRQMKLRPKENDAICMLAMHWAHRQALISWIDKRGLYYASLRG